MKRYKTFSIFFIITICLFTVVSTKAGDDWSPVTPGELAMKAPLVDPNADAEAIFWQVRVDDFDSGLVLKHYVRVKIFTEMGREKFSKIDIPFLKGMSIKNVAARVIKPDGTIIELKKEDVFDKEIFKANESKVNAKSFAVPGIDVGVIVEYRYNEIRPDSWANNMRLVMQRDIPIEDSTYYLRPTAGYDVKYLTFNMSNQKFEKEKGGYYKLELDNVPALKIEPNMPPKDEIQAWALIYYTENGKIDSTRYWQEVGGLLAEKYEIKETLKPSGELKNAVAEIIGGATTPEEKINKIYEYTRTKIKNFSYDPMLSDEDVKKMKPNKSPTDTYKKGQGFGDEIDYLFASLAVAAGLEPRIVFSGDRSDIFFSRRYAHLSFIHRACVAINLADGWHFYEPGDPFIPKGMLPWYEENQDSFLLSFKDYLNAKTPLSSKEKSVAKRTGKFSLSPEGQLEGKVSIEYTGHLAYGHRIDTYKDSLTKQEDDVKAEIKQQISTAEVSNIKITNLMDGDKPLIYSYDVKVPNYAQKTGKRLFLQPGFFEFGTKPLFDSDTRKNDIYFHFPWSENDLVEIDLPKGFALDNADAPAVVADPDAVGRLEIDIGVDRDQTFLQYKRNFHFGKGVILFPVTAYSAVKELFDNFHKADSHIVTLRQK